MYSELDRKRCSKCKSTVNGFYTNVKAKDGLASWCKKCQRSYIERYQKKKKALVARWKRKYALENPDKVQKTKAGYRERNREMLRAKNRRYQAKNMKRALARCRMYQGKKKNASPSWLTKEMKLRMRKFYEKTPRGFHVDHIVPLQGKNVCGLHVPWNLQYLPGADNLRKSNKI